MLLSSVILVLREFLEAALLFSLLMALSRWLAIPLRWVPPAMVVGLLGAAIFGFNLDRVSDTFDGVGQEVSNALLQIGIYMLLCVLAAVTWHRGTTVTGFGRRTIATLMAMSVALAIVREGSEVMIYLTGFLQVRDQLAAVVTGGLIGAGIGISVGAVVYFSLLNLAPRLAVPACAILLALVGAGFALQASQMLIQADWLPAGYPVWDSSVFIAEQSVTGQLLYALLGYEATPTALQVGVYGAALALMGLVMGIAYRRWQPGAGMRT